MSSKNSRVVFVPPPSCKGGPAVWLRRVCQYLPEHGWDCTVVLPPVEPEVDSEWKNWPCDLQVVGDAYSWAKLMRATVNRILACKPDIVVSVGGWHGLPNAMRYIYRRGLSSVPYLDTIMSDQLPEYERLRGNADVIARVGAVSESTRLHVTQLVPELAGNVDRFWSAVPSAPQPCFSSNRDGPLRIVFVGHLTQQYKRILDLPPIVAGMLSRAVDFKLELVGDGGDRRELEQRVFALPGAAGRITFHGWLPNDKVLELVANQDVMLLMSEVEGQPVALLEAMAQGLAPVVTLIPGLQELVRNGENGILLPVGDTAGFAQAFEELARDRGRLHRLRSSAWESVQQHAAMHNAVHGFASVLSKTVAGGTPDLSRVLPPRFPDGQMAALQVPQFVQGFKRWMLHQKVR